MISTATLDGDKILYTARTRTTGGREGRSRSDDGRLEVKLSTPGSAGVGTNPEQLFAAGWSACFEGAMGIAARKRRVALPAETSIDAEVDLILGTAGYSLAARMNIALPGIDPSTAREIVAEAEATCPYSKAVVGNVPVEINLV